jgi:hypothetical protein
MSDVTIDRFATANSVADAVLFEGYVLYPYRASSRKNQVRFQWGVLTPREFSEQEGSERWSMRTECVADPFHLPMLSVRIRFLQTQHRQVDEAVDGEQFVPVERLKVDGILHAEWDEAVEHIVDIGPLWLQTLDGSDHVEDFNAEGGTCTELLHDSDGILRGRFVRTRETVHGRARIRVRRMEGPFPYFKVTVTVENTTPWSGGGSHRDDAMGHSLIAVHIMLAIDEGKFISLLDPPPDAEAVATSCTSEGCYPVLIGSDDVVLASPIILYDHPEVASQSPGDLYDSLEIDEILALRVMTLTDQEKSEARGTDPRAAAIIDRCDDLSPETMGQLHGQMRPVAPLDVPQFGDEVGAVEWWDPDVDASFDPWTESVWISGVEITKGSAVRLQPSHRADAHDIFLTGMSATVAGVFTDVDGDQHVAVTVDDDPASQELLWQGRYLFFHPDEVVPLVDRERTP